MARKFTTPDYESTLDIDIKIGDSVPPEHLARFIVDIVAQLDLSEIYNEYGKLGGTPYAPQMMVALLFYAYATGVFSSRKIEKATYESIPFRYVAGNMNPDHATIAAFRKRFLSQLQNLFVQILLVASMMGKLKLGDISIDGSKVHADASKSKAVSYKHALKLKTQLEQEVKELFDLATKADGQSIPEGMVVIDEIERRQEKIEQLVEAIKVIEERANVRYQEELDEHEAKMELRKAKEEETGRKTSGRKPKSPTSGARDKDQYNFTDPDSRIMRNPTSGGFDQHYNVQVGVDHDSRLVVAYGVSDQPNDKQQAIPMLDAVPAALGRPQSAALDNGYFSQQNVEEIEKRGVEPYIATGREPHNQNWRVFFEGEPAPPEDDASPIVKMAHKLRTDAGKAVYRLRKSTVEPVIGIIKEVLGFRQFSLRGLAAVLGEWSLVCTAYNLKRMHILSVQ